MTKILRSGVRLVSGSVGAPFSRTGEVLVTGLISSGPTGVIAEGTTASGTAGIGNKGEDTEMYKSESNSP